jgi:predicted RNase H-like HicB family nuclease
METDRFEVDIVICPEGIGKNKIYSISSIQVPNVVTQGKTIEEAKKRLREALNLYFEDMPHKKMQALSNCQLEAPMISRIFL